MRTKVGYVAGIALAAVIMSGPAKAGPSFNCAYANIPTEIAICRSAQLSSLDRRMAARYFSLVNRAPARLADRFRTQQRAWLRARNACGYRVRCIERRYINQIARLSRWAQLPAVGG